MSTWPPTLADVKSDAKIDLTDTRDDASLQRELDAAIAYVQRQRKGAFQFDPADPTQFGLPAPSADIVLGTIRLTIRWQERRRSPDGSIDMGDLGSARVPGSDPDIDRLLGVGRFKGLTFG